MTGSSLLAIVADRLDPLRASLERLLASMTPEHRAVVLANLAAALEAERDGRALAPATLPAEVRLASAFIRISLIARRPKRAGDPWCVSLCQRGVPASI
jgi:hypothetical protein